MSAPASPAMPSSASTLADLTTLRIGGPVRRLVEARDEHELIAAVREADEAGEPLLVLGGGSNLVASDAPFEGTVVLVRDGGGAPRLDASCEIPTSGEPDGRPVDPASDEIPGATCGGVIVEHFAGVGWDDAVRYAVERELIGIEALSGIPGTVGAVPIQNVGAYGQEVAQTITRVRTWDREAGAVRTFFAADCAFAYRDSIFKRTLYGGPVPSATGRYVVLSVTFQHRQGDLSAPIRYAELARQLGVEVGDRAPMTAVRETVLRIRASKGMVLDSRDHDTWSAGSFFTNPILTTEQAEHLPEDAPRFPVTDHSQVVLGTKAAPVIEGLVKTSAAWLIDHAGFSKGFAVEAGAPAGLSTKHVLALTNRGGATGADLACLRDAVVSGVRERYGVTLVPEPVQVGF